ncbi:hypothetical protein F5887DRAFT_1080692 [Amanita rubescens]|nr:hypothetical protein F5887DRAFT_1080692 [Amanita rubescens]
MLDEPQNMRLHSKRAILGSYNLKDPPGSPTLKYPGPHWVPDNLRASWCAAETLTCCLSRDASITYKSTHRMLDSVLPDQRDCCEVGIELMLRDGCFTPERVIRARSSTDSSSVRLDPSDLHKSLRRSGSRALCLQENSLDELLRSHQKLMIEWREGLKLMPSSHSDSLSSVVVREQPRKTVLIREPPKRSPLSGEKSVKLLEVGKGLSAMSHSSLSHTCAPVLSSSPHSIPQRGNIPLAPPENVPRVSAPETQKLPERVQSARSMAVPSSAKLDLPPVSYGLTKSRHGGVHEPRLNPLTARPKVFKLSSETVVPGSRPSPSLSVRAKAREQSIKTVLDRDSPKGSSQADPKPSGPVVSALAPSSHGNVRAPERSPVGKREVSMEKRISAVRHSPVAEAAPTLLSMPVSCIRAPPAPLSKDGTSLSSRAFPTQRAHNASGMHRVVSTTTRREIKTPSRVSREPASPQSGKTLLQTVSERRVGFKATLQRYDKSPSAGVQERSTVCPKEGEERRMFSVINIQINKGEKVSPEPSEAPKQMYNPPSATYEPTSACKPATLSPSLSVCAKAQEQSIKTVLDRESLKGSSRVGSVPSGRIVSAPTPKRRNAMTPMKPSARKVEDSLEKRTSATKHSPVPNAALTLHNSTSILSIRPALAISSKDGARSSLQVTSTLVPSSVINACQVVSETTRRKVETLPRLSLESSLMRFGKTPIAGVVECSNEHSNVDLGPAIKQALMSSFSSKMGEKQRVSDTVVSRNKGTNEGTYQEVKTLSRVSSKTTTPWSDEPPSAGVQERSVECSEVTVGPFPVEQAQRRLISSSTKVEERRMPDAIVSSHNAGKEDESSTKPYAAFTPHASAPIALSVPLTRTGPLLLPSGGTIPHIEVVSGQCDLNVVNKASGAYGLCSPSLESAARKQPVTSIIPPSVEGEGQLARAAAYIQEHIKRRSSAPDEFPRYGSKEPPDKRMEIASTAIESRRLETDVVRARLEARTMLTLPPCRTKGVKLSHSSPEATLELPDSSLGTSVTDGQDLKPRQAVKAVRCADERLKTEESVLEESVMPAPRVIKSEWAPEGQPVSWAVSKIETRSACLRSPVTSAALTPFAPLPAFLSQALPSSLLSPELSGFLMKSPGEGDCKWRPIKAANSPNNPGVGMQSPESKTSVLTLVSKPNIAGVPSPRFLSDEHKWRACCKPPNTVASAQRRLFAIVIELILLSATWHSRVVFKSPVARPEKNRQPDRTDARLQPNRSCGCLQLRLVSVSVASYLPF